MGKAQQSQEQRYPFLSVRAVFSCVQTMVWLPVFGIFNVRVDVDSCNCTAQRLLESLHWKLTLGEKSLAALGSRTRVSTAPGFSVGTLYQLNYPRPLKVNDEKPYPHPQPTFTPLPFHRPGEKNDQGQPVPDPSLNVQVSLKQATV